MQPVQNNVPIASKCARRRFCIARLFQIVRMLSRSTLPAMWSVGWQQG
jgi:hypothetical protein